VRLSEPRSQSSSTAESCTRVRKTHEQDETEVRRAYNDTGELQSVDGYMNIALEQTKEYVDGKMRRNYGDAFVRGNNGEMLRSHFARS